MTNPLTHFDAQGQAHMVDVAAKPATHRIAIAQGQIAMRPETLALIEAGGAKKGDVLGVARIAGIQGAKKTSELIPLCHPLAITRVTVAFEIRRDLPGGAVGAAKTGIAADEANVCGVICTATVETIGPTGVEMEALTAVQIALLTVYDMCKAVDRGMTIGAVHGVEKHGGKSGSYRAG